MESNVVLMVERVVFPDVCSAEVEAPAGSGSAVALIGTTWSLAITIGIEEAMSACPSEIAAPPTSARLTFKGGEIGPAAKLTKRLPAASVNKGWRLPVGLIPATSVEEVGAVAPFVPTEGLVDVAVEGL